MLIVPLEEKTNINPSYSSGGTAGAIVGTTAGVTAGELKDQYRATDSDMIAQC